WSASSEVDTGGRASTPLAVLVDDARHELDRKAPVRRAARDREEVLRRVHAAIRTFQCRAFPSRWPEARRSFGGRERNPLIEVILYASAGGAPGLYRQQMRPVRADRQCKRLIEDYLMAVRIGALRVIGAEVARIVRRYTASLYDRHLRSPTVL